jgi:16S rRNA (guanine527-N7)-methyltransferase
MYDYDISVLEKDLMELGLELTSVQIEQFLVYYEMLAQWNQVMNLTAITEYHQVMKKHFVDSLTIVKACSFPENVSVIDVGTGAGFPGLVLKIVFPYLKLTLLDSLQKRISFLEAVIRKLDLRDIFTVHGRAEDVARFGKYRERYDLCVSRAVANLATLSEYCLPFVKLDGKFVSYKSDKVEAERAEAERVITILGGRIERQLNFCLPNSDIYRTLLVIQKIRRTPDKFPRRPGIPVKQPVL